VRYFNRSKIGFQLKYFGKNDPPDMGFVCASGFLARKPANENRHRPRESSRFRHSCSHLNRAAHNAKAQKKSRNDNATAFLIFALLVEEC
jgi:hypothetical protein